MPSMPLETGSAILLGGLAVGILDGLDAVIFFGLKFKATPIRVFQGVAAGLLGKEAAKGGVPTFLLGLGLHFLIATIIAAIYVLASRRAPALARHAVPLGLLYGAFTHLVMSYVVVPLSAAPSGAFSLPVFLNGILGHAFLVGLPAALAARAAAPRTRLTPSGAAPSAMR